MKKKSVFLTVLPLWSAILLCSIVSCVDSIPARPEGPGDIFAAKGTPCVSAHSTTRALYASYNGPLYQIMRESDGKTLDIGVVPPGKGDPGGYADAAAQDAFSANTLSWITVIYDQSGNGNHLYQAPPGLFLGPAKGGFNTLSIADMAPISVMGHKVYGTYIMPGSGYRNNDAVGLGINDEPEGIYMVVDGTHYSSGCCFNYGNTSTNSYAVGRATMSTVYFGTSTGWGSGSGTGPWLMSDMEAGLFSGYNTRVNEGTPTIDSWRFVTGMVNGGGGNIWELLGGNAQKGDMEVYYRGVRPQSNENSNYFPMNKKGSIQLGNGGDNGHGSSGTFYEGVMTKGYPSETAVKAVQANIVAAKYDVQQLSQSRITSFTPGSSQEVTVSFTNTTGSLAKKVTLNVDLPAGWKSNENTKTFGSVGVGNTVTTTFSISSPDVIASAGFFNVKAEWKNNKGTQADMNAQRIRSSIPVKLNEIRLNAISNSGNNPAGGTAPAFVPHLSNQFIELYNAADVEADVSNWTIMSTWNEWTPIKLATIPQSTKVPAKGFYVLGMANSGLATPARQGDNVINVISTTDFSVGHQIEIGNETRRIQSVGTPASPMTIIFVPVSHIPWLTIPAGSTNIPVKNTTGFEVGQKIGIDRGGNYHEAVVTAVGKPATQTKLAVAAKAGDTTLKMNSTINLTVGDILTVNTGSRKEIVEVKRIIHAATEPPRGGSLELTFNRIQGEVELTAPLKMDHMLAVDVSCHGTGISFTPATRVAYYSGDAVQALGSGIRLDRALLSDHEMGTPVVNPAVKTTGYQYEDTPNQWFGWPLSTSMAGGSIALMDATGKVVVDAMVFGSQQTNSSANGTITSPELATLEGVQDYGGNIVVVAGPSRQLPPLNTIVGEINRSFGRFPDGADTDNNKTDFFLQDVVTLLLPAASGSNNIKVGNTSGFAVGQQIIVGSGVKSQSVTICEVGTTGGTTVVTDTNPGTTVIPVASVEGFSTGQAFTIGGETATVASVVAVRRRFGVTTVPVDTIKVTQPLTHSHPVGTLVHGSGITFSTNFNTSFERGTPVANGVPTPGKPNQYIK